MPGRAPRQIGDAIFGGPPLPPSFYHRPTLAVARDLLGAILVRRLGRTVLAGRIVEVEAYLGRTDPASHAFRGKSRRNEVMFGEGGHLYVYFTYGMHYCANVVTGRTGSGSAVLIRAIEPLTGLRRMAVNRGLREVRSPRGLPEMPGAPAKLRLLAGGPARLCQALEIGARENGASLQGPGIFIVAGDPVPRSLIARGPRIGISAGTEKLWRLFIGNNPFLSRR